MAKAKLLRYLIAFLTAICVAAVLSSFTWLGGEMLRAFPLYLIGAAVFGIWVGLPIYSFLRSRRKDSIVNTVVVIALAYGIIYFLLRIGLSMLVDAEAVDGVAWVKDGLLTFRGLAAVALATVEVIGTGCIANFTFWIAFGRRERTST